MSRGAWILAFAIAVGACGSEAGDDRTCEELSALPPGRQCNIACSSIGEGARVCDDPNTTGVICDAVLDGDVEGCVFPFDYDGDNELDACEIVPCDPSAR